MATVTIRQPALSGSQQAAFYYMRKRRREREGATPSEFRVQGTVVGVTMVVILSAK